MESQILKENRSLIHPTAIVDKKAQIAEGVRIGPYCIVGPGVKIGKDTTLSSHVVIEGGTVIGERNLIGSGTYLGAVPQVKDFWDLSKSFLVIGNDNVIREHVTISTGTDEKTPTTIGDRNLFMIQSHVGHDAVLGNDILLANCVGLSGHVVVEDNVVIGGLVGVHQFVRIGRLSMVGGLSRVTKDIPPCSMCSGIPIRLHGINSVGLRRLGYTSQQATSIRKAIRMLFMRGTILAEAIAQIRAEFRGDPDIEHLAAFCEKSKRGLCRFSADAADEEEGTEGVEV